jgi:translation initiation factor 2B subunit (eIF-2B alpha/beta/delta family)
MRVHHRIFICLLIALSLITGIAQARTLSVPPAKEQQLKEQVKEKTTLLKHHLKANLKLENGIKRREREIERLLTELYDNNTITQRHIENNINPSMSNIDNQVDKIKEIQKPIWDYINLANDNLDAKNYLGYLENIDSALEALEEREIHLR